MYATDGFSHPQKNILQMGLSEGMKVGDFGTGTGHYAIALAGILGPEGRVYAVDIQKDVLTHLRDTLEQKKIRTVDTICGDIEKPGGTKLRAHVLNAIILSNTLFQIEDTKALTAEIKRTLVPGGKLLVSDWAGSYGGMGPAPHQIVTEHEAEELFISAGFHKVKSYRSGPHHYSILFTCPVVE
jgi:ubiquinone/menaquinone biosynthesis C-methylase UbiE